MSMCWKFVTFCVLVTLIIFVVISCVHGRSVVLLFCCEDENKTDRASFENYGNNFLRERLVGVDLSVEHNDTIAVIEDIDEIIDRMRILLNVHDPTTRDLIFSEDTTETDDGINDNSITTEHYLEGLDVNSDTQSSLSDEAMTENIAEVLENRTKIDLSELTTNDTYDKKVEVL